MNEFQHQIDNLRRRYQAGDASAREALFALLQTYVLLVIRRAARPENAKSAAAAGIRRLARKTRQANDTGAVEPGIGFGPGRNGDGPGPADTGRL